MKSPGRLLAQTLWMMRKFCSAGRAEPHAAALWAHTASTSTWGAKNRVKLLSLGHSQLSEMLPSQKWDAWMKWNGALFCFHIRQLNTRELQSAFLLGTATPSFSPSLSRCFHWRNEALDFLSWVLIVKQNWAMNEDVLQLTGEFDLIFL